MARILFLMCTLLFLAAATDPRLFVSADLQEGVVYTIKSRTCGNRALTIDNTGNLVLQDYTSQIRQQWTFKKVRGFYYIYSLKTPLVLDTYSPAPTFYARAEKANNERSQRWKIVESTRNGYHLVDWEGRILFARGHENGAYMSLEKFGDNDHTTWMVQPIMNEKDEAKRIG